MIQYWRHESKDIATLGKHCGTHPNRVKLEFRYLSIRVQRLVRKQVGRRFPAAEGQGDLARTQACVYPGLGCYLAASGTQAELPARRHAEFVQVVRVQTRDRPWLDGIQHCGTAAHSVGVPVLELTSSTGFDMAPEPIISRRWLKKTEDVPQ